MFKLIFVLYFIEPKLPISFNMGNKWIITKLNERYKKIAAFEKKGQSFCIFA